jgi:DNA polymerase bacteriophage-type
MAWERSLYRMFRESHMTRILIDGDFKNIEGRVNAWLSNEQWKLQAFKDFDNGTGPDLYKIAYARAFGIPHETVDKNQRQRGKVMELAGGYQGGVGSYISMGPTYGIRPSDLVSPVRAASFEINPNEWEKVCSQYEKAPDKRGLVRDEWTAIKILIFGWRKTNPRIVQSWYELQKAAITAVDNPNQIVTVKDYRNVTFLRRQGFLWLRLPSGRHITYFNPRIEASAKKMVVRSEEINGKSTEIHYPIEDFDPAELAVLLENGEAEVISGKERRAVVFDGKVQGGKGAKWGKKHSYGGLWCENIVQGASYDVQAAKMLSVEDEGFPIVMHTHDSITSEAPASVTESLTERYRDVMAQPLSWCPDLPIEVEVHAGKRYAGS